LIRQQPAIVVFGPTAVGKTAFIKRLFSRTCPVEIINADSMQVYRHLDIGTAKPSGQLLERIPHHLIDIVEPDQQFNAGEFVRRAERLTGEILGRGRLPLLCGGAAYYLRSFINGLPDSPPGDLRIRKSLRRQLQIHGLQPLLQELERVDPVTRAALHERDSYRIIRALEVFRSSGRSLSSFTRPVVPRRSYRFLLIGLIRERGQLYERINERVERMFAAGLVEEVRKLLRMGYGYEDPGMRGIGYREFFEMRSGCLTICQVKEMIKMHSRRYAKRQITFFKSLPEVRWEDPEGTGRLDSLMEEFISTHLPDRQGS
jgi:tRNA dimethylallyltransferase